MRASKRDTCISKTIEVLKLSLTQKLNCVVCSEIEKIELSRSLEREVYSCFDWGRTFETQIETLLLVQHQRPAMLSASTPVTVEDNQLGSNRCSGNTAAPQGGISLISQFKLGIRTCAASPAGLVFQYGCYKSRQAAATSPL